MKWISVFADWIACTYETAWMMTVIVIVYAARWFVYLTSGIEICPEPLSKKSFREQMKRE